jgi:hypothetical protein
MFNGDDKEGGVAPEKEEKERQEPVAVKRHTSMPSGIAELEKRSRDGIFVQQDIKLKDGVVQSRVKRSKTKAVPTDHLKPLKVDSPISETASTKPTDSMDTKIKTEDQKQVTLMMHFSQIAGASTLS